MKLSEMITASAETERPPSYLEWLKDVRRWGKLGWLQVDDPKFDAKMIDVLIKKHKVDPKIVKNVLNSIKGIKHS